MRKYGSPRTYQIRGLQAEGTAADLQFQIARPEPQRISYDVHSPVCLTKRIGQIQYHLSPLDCQHHKRPKPSRCQLIGYSHFNVSRIQPYVITYFDTAGVDGTVTVYLFAPTLLPCYQLVNKNPRSLELLKFMKSEMVVTYIQILMYYSTFIQTKGSQFKNLQRWYRSRFIPKLFLRLL